MDQTPTRSSRSRHHGIRVLDQSHNGTENLMRSGKIRKPPPITPRRFNKFFTPRLRAETAISAVRTSRKALRTISSSALNSRAANTLADDYGSANENELPRKKRKYSAISSSTTTPISKTVSFLPSSQDILPSSPMPYGRNEEDVVEVEDDSDASTEIDEDAAWSHDDEDLPRGPRAISYAGRSTGRRLLANRLGGRSRVQISDTSNLWQAETADFYSDEYDQDTYLRYLQPPIIPFSMTPCNTNPVVAVGDEEGSIRLLDPHLHASSDTGSVKGFGKTVLSLQTHNNAIMDMAFSADDNIVATASGDQTCTVVDVQKQAPLFCLRAHTASVKKIVFQPGSGDQILASAGRDGSIHLWDLRVRPVSTRFPSPGHEASQPSISTLSPVLAIHDAHNPNSKHQPASRKVKQGSIAGRQDFSITSLTFLDSTRNNLIASASEVDTVIKVWDLRQSQVSARKKGHSQLPVTITKEPVSHARHRQFGINSIATSTDSSRIFALSRDHTVYAYSTSHLILGCSPDMTITTHRSRIAPMRNDSGTGLEPIYGLRHPQLRVATFWPRLAIRKCNDTNSELLAVASTDDCAIVFPTSEKYHTKSTRSIQALHDPNAAAAVEEPMTPRRSRRLARPGMIRRPTSSFTTLFTEKRQQEDAQTLPIYYHGTPLVRGHNKEVTSVAWNSEGSLITASDDFTIRCWREDARITRQFRDLNSNRDAGALMHRGFADVGVSGWDDEY